MANFKWAVGSRNQYDRSNLKYPSDLTDAEWALVEGLIPPAKRGGNKRTLDVRRVVDGLMYVFSTGCQWTAVPKDMPPRTTLNDYFRRWEYDGTLARIQLAICGTCQNNTPVACAGAMICSKGVKISEPWSPRSDPMPNRPEINQNRGNMASW